MTDEHIRGKITAYKMVLSLIEEEYTTGEIAELLQKFIDELSLIVEDE